MWPLVTLASTGVFSGAVGTNGFQDLFSMRRMVYRQSSPLDQQGRRDVLW